MVKSKTPTKVSELIPDDKNFNKGNPFGEGLIEKSFSKFGAGRSILLDKNNRIIAGNKSTQKFAEGGGENIIVVETDGNTLVAVKRTDIDLDTPQGREMALADNAASKANIEWDVDILNKEWNIDKLIEWGVNNAFENTLDDKGSIDDKELTKWVPDCLFPSNNEYDIPTLLIELQATELNNPVRPYGADSRSKVGVGTYHFYVDDYRFEAIWDNPINIINSDCASIIEPNLSLYNTTPIGYGIYLIFKKRWIARYLQSLGISVFVDLNVNSKFAELNLLGVPNGWASFATRAYSDRIIDLENEYNIAKRVSGGNPIFVIYGGGKKAKEFSMKNNCIFVEQFNT